MNIAVYSGSFNPLHKGHEAILRFLTREGGFDKVCLVVTPQNPLKDENHSALERFQAAREALARHPDIHAEVLDIELKMAPPQYTIRTLDCLKAAAPSDHFILVIGADNLALFPSWRDYGRILSEYGVAVFPRKGYHRGHLRARLLKENPSYQIRLLNAPPVDISSTQIREGLCAGADMSQWLM